MKLLTFGDIFYYGGRPHVYLASNSLVSYCALIVRQKDARDMLNHEAYIMRQGRLEQQAALKENLSYCFVVLKTEGFAGDIAKLDRTDEHRDETRFTFGDEKLCAADQKLLKEEILANSMPRGLKRQVEQLDV